VTNQEMSDEKNRIVWGLLPVKKVLESYAHIGLVVYDL
jgi:hypothetical protein